MSLTYMVKLDCHRESFHTHWIQGKHQGSIFIYAAVNFIGVASSTPVKGEPVHVRKDVPTTPPLQPSLFISFTYFLSICVSSYDGQDILKGHRLATSSFKIFIL